jgi:hypothetical protein
MRTIKLPVIVRKPLGVGCPKCKKGVLFRVTLSRLEEGLGHEGFRCDPCGYAVKYVPPREASRA